MCGSHLPPPICSGCFVFLVPGLQQRGIGLSIAKTVARLPYSLKLAISLIAPSSFPFSHPPSPRSSCLSAVCPPFPGVRGREPGQLSLGHCSPHLKTQTRKLCFKDLMCGNHSAWLPSSCVCVNSLINIAGKDRFARLSLCHSWKTVRHTQDFCFPRASCCPHLHLKEFCSWYPRAGPVQKTGRRPFSSGIRSSEQEGLGSVL